jgi:hypothetical protein
MKRKRIVRRRVRRNSEDESDNCDALDLVEDWMAGGGQNRK